MSKRDDKNKRRRKRKEKKEKQRTAGFIRLPVAWPSDLSADPESMTDAELLAIVTHPMATGIGSHPKTTADADYIERCQKTVATYGIRAFADYLLRLLHATTYLPWAYPQDRVEGQPVPPPVQQRSKLSLPMTRVDFPGDRHLPKDKWTPGMVMATTLNPAVTGLPPFPPMIPTSLWLAAFTRMMQTDGVVQTLVDFLCVLRWTYGVAGVSAGHTPFGYTLAEGSNGDEQDDDFDDEFDDEIDDEID